MSIDPRIGRANRETFHIAKAFIDRQDYNRFAADPLPDVDRNLAKYKHAYEIGDRVTVVNPQWAHQSSGMSGKITASSAGHDWEVQLDSGDLIHVMESEITPEGFAAPVVARDADALEDATKSFRKSRLTLTTAQLLKIWDACK